MRIRVMPFIAAALFCTAGAAVAQTQPYIGQVMLTASFYCPKGWVPLDGRVLHINQYTALFSVIGANYGGDGHLTFALPKAQPIPTNGGPPLLQCMALNGAFPVPN